MARPRPWIALVACGIACSKPGHENKAASSAPPPASAAPAAHASAASASDVTGVLSEEQFKRLHELKGEAAPPARGVTIDLSDGSKAYLSLPPDAKPPLPGLVVVHEWWGLNEHIKHYADRLAADGYAALAVDLFRGQVATTPDQAIELVKGVQEEQAKATLLAAYQALGSDSRVRATRRGSIGWCFGGGWSFKLALLAQGESAAVVYYGHVTTDAKQMAGLKTPVLGIFGKRDASIPAETVKQFDQALSEVGTPHRVLTYDAEHAFANPSGARYDEKSAEAAWRETRAFLAKYVKGS